MNIAAERELPLQPLLGDPEDEHETLDVVRADSYYGEYSGYGYTPKKE